MTLPELLAAMDSLVLAEEKPRSIEIKGLGTVYVRDITIGEVDEQIADTSDKANQLQTARAATRLLCDENGKRLLDPNNEDHVEKMARLPFRVLAAINAAQEQPPGN